MLLRRYNAIPNIASSRPCGHCSDRPRRSCRKRPRRLTRRGCDMRFRNRYDAGRRLAAQLGEYAGRDDVIVLALPRGGVPVGAGVARPLGVPFDIFLVRKLGVPGHEELAMGAIASGGVRVLNRDVLDQLRIASKWVDVVAAQELEELTRREAAYRDGRPAPDV